MLFIRAGDLLEPRAACAPCPSAVLPKGRACPVPTTNTPKTGSRFLAPSAPLAQELMQSMGHPTAGTGWEQSPWLCYVFPLGSRGDGSQPPAPCAQECTDIACTEKFPFGCKISPSTGDPCGGHGSLCPAIALLRRSTKQKPLKPPKSPKTHRHSSQPQQEACFDYPCLISKGKKSSFFPAELTNWRAGRSLQDMREG